MLKRTFKGIFKRGKKSKTDQDQSATTSATTSQQTSTTTSQAAAPTTHSAAPQLPPVQQNDKPLQSQIDESKPLPPTHPLSTGQHDSPQEAVPQNYDAQPGPPEGTAISALNDGAGGLQEPQRDTTAVSSLEASPERAEEGRKSEVSAIENNDPLASQTESQEQPVEEKPNTATLNTDPLAPSPPSKNDSGIEDPKGERIR